MKYVILKIILKISRYTEYTTQQRNATTTTTCTTPFRKLYPYLIYTAENRVDCEHFQKTPTPTNIINPITTTTAGVIKH